MPQGLSYEDAMKGGLVYGTDAQGQRSQYTDMQATPDQQAYARSVALSRNPGASIGSPDNPSYDTPDAQGSPGSYHVTPTGRLSAPAPPPTHLAKEIQGIPYEQAVNDFRPGEGWDNRPTSEALGFGKGVNSVLGNVVDAMSAKLPHINNPTLDALQGVSPANVLTMPAQAAERDVTGALTKAEQTSKPGQIGQFAGAAVAGVPFAMDFDLPQIATWARPLLQGGLQGTITGDSKNPVDRLEGAVLGSLSGKAGDKVLGMAGRIASPRISPQVQTLLDANVPMTLGQLSGPSIGRLESGMSSFPIVGDMIGNARRGSLEGLNLAVANRALAPIGESLPKDVEPGREAIAKAGDTLSARYEALLPSLTVQPDSQFHAAVNAITAPGTDLTSQHADQFAGLVNRLITSKIDPATGILPGSAMKEAEAKIGQRMTKYGRSGVMNVADSDMADALGSLRDELRGLVVRNNPQAADELSKLNEGWANLAIGEKAAASLGAHEGMITPGQLAGAVKGANESVRKRGYARGEALMQDLSDAAQARLPSKVPDSGSPYRHALEAAVAGMVGKEAGLGPELGKITLAASVLGAPYTGWGRPLVQAAMTKRLPVIRNIGNTLQTLKPLAAYLSGTGAPILANLPSLEAAPQLP